MKQLISILSILTLFSSQVVAQVSFKATANKAVEVGENFRLNFTVNAEGSNFKPPKSFAGFRVLAGPSTSTSSSYQWINGKASQSISNTYSYILQATRAGKFTIPEAQITVDGKVYKSNPITVEVVKGTVNANANQQSETQSDASTENVKDQIFVRINLNKSKVYLGEQIIATIKIYTRVGLRAFDDFKFPAYTGFWSQDIETPNQVSLERENVNGVIYNVGVLRKSILFPQRTGKIKIDPFELSCIVQQKAGKRRNFFGELVDVYKDVKVDLVSPPRTVTVMPLPVGKPASFSGAVGSNFKLSANVDRNQLKNNESLTLKVKISGNGNLKLIDKINIDFPKTFEVYDPKIKENISNTSAGARGTKIFEYLLIPREQGDYVIPSIKFSYFDVDSKEYKTLSVPDIPVKVEKGDAIDLSNTSISVSKEDIRTLGSDIRFIKQDKFELKPINKHFFGSLAFYLYYLISLFVFVVFVFFMRHKIKQNANAVLMKNKRANKISKKRLKMAASYLKQNDKSRFYDEVIHALWGYLSDKLNIPVSELSRDTVKETLQKHNISEDIIANFLKVIDDCEFAKYAPASESNPMEEDYKRAREVINKFEEVL